MNKNNKNDNATNATNTVNDFIVREDGVIDVASVELSDKSSRLKDDVIDLDFDNDVDGDSDYQDCEYREDDLDDYDELDLDDSFSNQNSNTDKTNTYNNTESNTEDQPSSLVRKHRGFYPGDPRINRNGRPVTPKSRRKTSREKRCDELGALMRRLKPLQATAIQEAQKIMMGKRSGTTPANQLAAIKLLTDMYSQVSKELHEQRTEEQKERQEALQAKRLKRKEQSEKVEELTDDNNKNNIPSQDKAIVSDVNYVDFHAPLDNESIESMDLTHLTQYDTTENQESHTNSGSNT